MDLIAFLLLVGITLAIPLGLAILSRRALGPFEERLLKITRFVHPVAALSVVASSFFRPGRLAAGLILPWIIFGGVLGITALVRLKNGGWRFPASLCYTAALGYLPVGAGWLFASRAGMNPGGFGEPIVLLTAVHFHFSGFVASILAGEVTRHAENHSRATAWITSGVILGMPLIAAGFVCSALLKIIGILFFSSTLATLATIQFLSARQFEAGWPRRMLRISSASIVLGMLLALIYGVTEYFDWPVLTVPQMAHFHGILNAFGFSLCGLIGWLLIGKKEDASC